jgi:two-component system, chemotaxis family, sensor kinase Cph1
MDVTDGNSGNDGSQAAEQIEQLKQQYENCVNELAIARREAEKSAQAARNAEAELKYFAYAASHDLQQPLRAIGTHAQLLQRETESNQRTRELASVISENASQMNALVRDLLTYSRIGLDPQLNDLDLNGPLHWALFNLADAIKKAEAKVITAQMPTALADEKQLVTVFEHLLTNALLYHGPERPRIEVTADSDSDSHTVSVRDNGIGIKPEFQEKVFEPFKRLHTAEIPGRGLGLAMCRKILRAHQGRIWVESDGEHGSTFKFALPA